MHALVMVQCNDRHKPRLKPACGSGSGAAPSSCRFAQLAKTSAMAVLIHLLLLLASVCTSRPFSRPVDGRLAACVASRRPQHFVEHSVRLMISLHKGCHSPWRTVARVCQCPSALKQVQNVAEIHASTLMHRCVRMLGLAEGHLVLVSQNPVWSAAAEC